MCIFYEIFLVPERPKELSFLKQIFIANLTPAKHWARSFTCSISLNMHTFICRYYYIVHFTVILGFKEVGELGKLTQRICSGVGVLRFNCLSTKLSFCIMQSYLQIMNLKCFEVYKEVHRSFLFNSHNHSQMSIFHVLIV